MKQQIKDIEDCSLTLPITIEARRIAQQFSRQQPTPEKAEQVRLNTLAVRSVNDYLQMMGIPTDLASSDSWNPIVRLCANVADLEVIGLGRLECRAIAASEQTCYVPPEVWEDRIAYVVVQLDEARGESKMLGFAKQATQEHLPIGQLQPLENLLLHLNQLSSAKSTVTNLSHWLKNTFESGWQTVESALNPAANLTFSFRKADRDDRTDFNLAGDRTRRAKLIDLGMQLAGHSVALVVELRPESPQKTSILLQVHPTGNQLYLPPLLQLVVLDESGAIFLEAKARRADNYIQLQFSGSVGERFSVKVALDEVSITENFAI